jgi:hypothetical protein
MFALHLHRGIVSQDLSLNMYRTLVTLSLIFLLAPTLTFGQQGWQPVSTPLGGDVDVLNDSTLAIMGGAYITCSGNGGSSWTKIAKLPQGPTLSFTSIRSTGPHSAAVYGGEDSYLYQILGSARGWGTGDSGKSWSSVAQENGYGVEFRLLDHGMRTPCYGRTSVHLPNAAETVRTMQERQVWPLHVTTYGLDFNDSIGVALVPLYPDVGVMRSTNFGDSWIQDTIRLLGPPTCQSVRACLNTWFIANSNQLLRSIDSGATWNAQWTFSQPIVGFNFFDSVGYVCLAGADYIERTSNAGLSWFPQQCGNDAHYMRDVDPTSRSIAYAWGDGLLMKITDPGNLSPSRVLSMPRTLDFGEVPADILQTQNLVVRNIGIDTIRVTGYLSDSMNVTLTPSVFTIASGDSFTVTVKYKTRNGVSDAIRVTLQTNALPSDQAFVVRGSAAIPIIKYLSRSIDFGNVRIGETQTKFLRLGNIGKAVAAFQKPKPDEPSFYVTGLDTLKQDWYENLSIRFTPQKIGQVSAKLLINSNALTSDTLFLEGFGITTEAITPKVDWTKSIEPIDSLAGIATNLLPRDSRTETVCGVVSKQPEVREFVVLRLDSQGSEQSRCILDSNFRGSDAKVFLETDANGGSFIEHDVDRYSNICITHLNYGAQPDWQDTVRGLNQNLPITLLSSSNGRCALSCSGFTYQQTTFLGDLGQVQLRIYERDGRRDCNTLINGDSYHFIQRIGYANGPDYGVSGVWSNSGYLTSLTLDHGRNNSDLSGVVTPEYTADVWKYKDSSAIAQYSEVNSSGSGVLAYSNGIIYEAGKSQDTGYYLLELDDSLHLLRRGTIDKIGGLDSIYSIGVDTTNNSLYLLGRTNTERAGRNTTLIRMSADSKELWQQTFDGLGSGDDIPVKLIVAQGFAYILVKSADTSGNDFVLLKYDSAGKLLYRLRYDGPGHKDDVPRDFAIGSGGAIYIVGGATNAKGVQQFTVIKYIDSELATVQPQVIPKTIDARLTTNPWLFSTTLEITKPPSARVNVRVYDLLGREYFNRTTTANLISLNSAQYAPGFYTLLIEGEDGSRKLIKFIRQ